MRALVDLSDEKIDHPPVTLPFLSDVRRLRLPHFAQNEKNGEDLVRAKKNVLSSRTMKAEQTPTFALLIY
jgi:hypothetical protein